MASQGKMTPQETVEMMIADHGFAHQFFKDEQVKAQQHIQSLPTLEAKTEATEKFNNTSSHLHNLWLQNIAKDQAKNQYRGLGDNSDQGWCQCTHHYLLEEPESDMVRALKELNAMHINEQREHDLLLKNAFTSQSA